VQKGSKSKLLEFEVSGSSCCSIAVAVRVGIKTAVLTLLPVLFPLLRPTVPEVGCRMD